MRSRHRAVPARLPGRLAAGGLAALLLAAAPRPARADEPPAAAPSPEAAAEAKAHLQRGVELFSAREYEAAIKEFEAGYALDPRPELLFALAQAERLSGDCASAVFYYRDFLKSNPNERQAEAARTNLSRCEEVLATSRGAQSPEPAPKPDTGEPAAAPAEPDKSAAAPAPIAPPAAAPRPWYTDVVGDSLLGAGVVAAAAGGLVWLRSADERQRALDATLYTDYTQHMDDARSQRTIAIGALSAGVLLTGAAVARYLTRDRGEAAPAVGVTLQPDARGVVFAVAGGF